MKLRLFTLILFSTPLLMAAESGEKGPCIKLQDICRAAGFGKSTGPEKKSMLKDCMPQLLSGQKVEGVVVEPADIIACKAKKNEIKTKK